MSFRAFGVLLALSLCTVHVPASTAGAPPTGRRQVLLGRSVDGRPIIAVERGDFDASRRVLVVGCIHGDESAGVAIAERLTRIAVGGVDLWIVPVLNPDGFVRRIRGNAHGVDLNRNFPWRWRRLGGVFDSGQHPLSEPESQIAFVLIRRLHPSISLWFHQHLNVVDESGDNVQVEQRYARLVGLPLARLPREPGSVVGWENHSLPGTTAFVVELPGGSLSKRAVDRYAGGVVALAP